MGKASSRDSRVGHERFSLVGLALTLGTAGSLALSGCGKPPPPPPPPPPTRAPTPPAPEPLDTEALVQQLRADARVQFPNSVAPTSEELARAIIGLADAFARGDATALRPMLDPSGVSVLDELQASGAWDETTKRIEAIRITSLNAGDDAMPSADLTFAIQEPAAAYQLRWHATPGVGGSGYTFSPMESDGTVMARAGDFDGSSGAVDTGSVGSIPGTTPGQTPSGSTPGGGGPPTEAGG